MQEFSKNLSHDNHLKTVDLGTRETTTGGSAPEAPKQKNERGPNFNRNRGLVIGAGALTLVIAATTFFSTQGSGDHNSTSAKGTETSAPSNTPKPTHSETTSQNPTPTIEKLITNAEIKNNSDPTVLSQNILSGFSAWNNYGGDDAVTAYDAMVRKTADGSDATQQKFLKAYADKAESIYGPAFFGKDYASNESIKTLLDTKETIIETTLKAKIATQNGQHPYTRSLQFTQLADSTPTTLSIDYVEDDNSGPDADQVSTNKGVNGDKGTLDVTYTVVGDTIVMQSASFNLN